jgi:hypothetical protein
MVDRGIPHSKAGDMTEPHNRGQRPWRKGSFNYVYKPATRKRSATVTLYGEALELAEKRAKRQGITFSAYCTRLVRNHLDRISELPNSDQRVTLAKSAEECHD